MPTPTPPRRGGAFVMVAITLLTGLASGALCCLLALMIKRDPAWLMLPCALGIGWFTRWQGYRGRSGAGIAATAILICLIYAQYLYAAVRMADMLGFPLRDTLFKMDWRLAWQLFAANLGALNLVAFVLAPLLAASIAARGRADAGPGAD